MRKCSLPSKNRRPDPMSAAPSPGMIAPLPAIEWEVFARDDGFTPLTGI